MFRLLVQFAGLAVAALVTAPNPGFADIEHVRLQQPCSGKTGRAIASYSWLVGPATEREHIFTDLCLDLDAMRVFSVENSDALTPAYRAPGQMSYYSYPSEGSDRYRETISLLTDVLHIHDYELMMENPDALPSPEAPDVLSTFEWVKGSNARPLDRAGKISAWLHGFVGGVQPERGIEPGRYLGFGGGRIYTKERDSRLSGVGINVEAELAVTEQGAEVELRRPSDVGSRGPASATLALEFHGDEISGRGRFHSEHEIESRESDSVWKRVDLEVADLTGKLTGEDGDHIYVLIIWDGTYTDFAGGSYPADAVMTFNAIRQD